MPRNLSQPGDADKIEAPPKVENIQALRGVAALLVLWAHLKYGLWPLAPQVENDAIIHTVHGAIGVDLFFIISGFVISLTACKRHTGPLDFFLARVARVSPLYLASMILVFGGSHGSAWPVFTFNNVWNQVFYLPIFDWGSYTNPPISVGWTLSFEMWFYVVFALLLNFWPPRKVAYILPIIFCIGAPLMTLYHGDWYFPRFMFHPYVLEFSLGCLVFQVQNHLSSRMSWLLLIAGIIFTVAFTRHTGALGYEGASSRDLAWVRVFLWGLPCACVVAGLVGLERHHDLRLPGVLIWLGGISYSLYLTHFFSMGVAVRVGYHTGIRNPWFSVFDIVVIAVFIAWLCHKWVERPLSEKARAFFQRQFPSKAAKMKVAVAAE